ncbi:hypothetical protein, partial [Phormidium sp. FACHB-1136]|uniref:hypothetical protein n=1 Tax=Phormidium sp. FACHB-1136 TaxID=2692848 RepID=UPI001A7EF85B
RKVSLSPTSITKGRAILSTLSNVILYYAQLHVGLVSSSRLLGSVLRHKPVDPSMVADAYVSAAI